MYLYTRLAFPLAKKIQSSGFESVRSLEGSEVMTQKSFFPYIE